MKFTVASATAPVSLTTAKLKLLMETAVILAKVFCAAETGSVDMVINGVVVNALVNVTVPVSVVPPSVYRTL